MRRLNFFIIYTAMNICMYIHIYVSATGKHVVYTHQHKTALP